MAADSEPQAQGTQYDDVQLPDVLETDGGHADVQSNGNGTDVQSNGVEQPAAQDGQQVDQEQEQEQAVENVFQLTIHLPHAPVRQSPTLFPRHI